MGMGKKAEQAAMLRHRQARLSESLALLDRKITDSEVREAAAFLGREQWLPDPQDQLDFSRSTVE